MGEWVIHLKSLQLRHKKPLNTSRARCQFFPDRKLNDAALDCILQMMSAIPQDRPRLDTHGKYLNHIGEPCADCQFKVRINLLQQGHSYNLPTIF